MERTLYKSWSVPKDPFSRPALLTLGPLSPPLRSFVSSHLAALPPSGRPCPQGLPSLAGTFRSALPAPGSGAHSACSSHPHSCCKRRKGGRCADGSETVALVSAVTPGKLCPGAPAPLSNYSSVLQGPEPSSAGYPCLSRRVGPGYFATLSFPASGVALHPFQLPLATSCPLPRQSL